MGAFLRLDIPAEQAERKSFGIVAEREIIPDSPRLTREFYIYRIAVAWVITDCGTDPQHPDKAAKIKTVVSPNTERTEEVTVRCCCRHCRAWACLRNTPPDELAEAVKLAESQEYLDDRVFL